MSAITQIRPKSSTDIHPAILRIAVDTSPQAFAIVESGRIVYANRSLSRLYEIASPADMLGRTLSEVTPPSADQLPPSTTKFAVDGREFLLVHTQPKNGAAGEFTHSQRLEAVGRLVGGVAHDFNNLLTGIVLSCDLLLVKLDTSSPLRRYAEEMRKAGTHGAKLIQQLLGVARPHKSELGLVSLNEVIGGMGDLLARLIGESIALKLKLAPDLRFVKMDPAQAEQIVLNLVLNARDAMPDGGQISLITRNCVPAAKLAAKKRKISAGVRLEVADTGCGMDRKTCARIFEPFFTTKNPGQGNGLGLATVKEIVKQANGTIEVKTRPGKGTQIAIFLSGTASQHTNRPEAVR
jgi:signal transduction histidine kinase